MNKKNHSIKRLIYCGLMVAGGMVLAWVEFLLPINLGVPGIKLGLANAATLLALYMFGAKYATAVALMRCTLSALLFSGAVPMAYSLMGGVLSLAVMILLKRTNAVGIPVVSACGGAVHNMGQLLVATVLYEQSKILYYTPVLIIAGVVTGVLVGVLADIVIKRLPKNII